jgi:D-alanyl-D-alanine carboxypeptidase
MRQSWHKGRACEQGQVNLCAECRLGASSALSGEGSWERSRGGDNFPQAHGIADTEFKVDDGCGLSRDNRVRANAIVRSFRQISSADIAMNS